MLKQHYMLGFIIIVVISIEYVSECNGYHFTSSSYHNLTRHKRQAGCRKRQYLCDNGECIPIKNYCDGKSDCIDESDEELNCNTNGCSSNKFQCTYGACIEGTAKCDGKQDCRDNSDEDTNVCKTLRPDECSAPVIEYGNYTVLESNEYKPGNPIPNFSIVNIFCVNNNYIINKLYSIVYCVNGIYKPELPKCVLTCATTFSYSIDVDCKLDGEKEDCTKNTVRAGTVANIKCKADFIDKNPEISKTICLSNGSWDAPPKECTSPHKCPPRSSTAINVLCELNGGTQDCTKEVPDGTHAHMTCIPDYIDINDGPTEAICSNGTWNAPIKKCVPDCNRIVLEGQTFIVNGSSANRGDFPWHVAIYRQKPHESLKYHCGGSIISVKIILSAAHCFTDQNNGNTYPVSEFSVAAGKKYSQWNAPEDKYYVQKRNVTKIYTIRDIYFGQLSNFAGDIAVVVVDKLFIFTNFIKPVCIDWNSQYIHQQLVEGVKGKIAGWGATTTGTPKQSVDLKQLTMPFVRKDQCLNKVSYNFKAYVTYDKFCAGYINAASSVCNGDSGGGMVFPVNNYRKKLYYLQGITSVGQTHDGYCDNNQLAVYTTVSSHIKFVREIEESNRISLDCAAPTISNGKFIVSDLSYMLGTLIKESSEITIECNSGYKLSANNLPKCIAGQWSIEIPKCEQETITPILPKPPKEGECFAPIISNGRFEILGHPNYVAGNPIPNFAIVNFTCNSERYSLTTTNSLDNCINGVFLKELPKCVPSCPPINSTSVDVKCLLYGVEISCFKKVPEGTIATMKCKSHYVQYIRGHSTALCMDGSWDVPPIKCSAECGKLTPRAQPLIIQSTPAKRGDFPWHVAIYKQLTSGPMYICGGSIISEKLVLSAAHCFTNANDGQLNSPSKYSVAAGKYFSKWDAPQDEYTVQKRKIAKIEIPKDYVGSISVYAGDIAVVVVDEPFTFTNLIKPVCVDWTAEIVDQQLKKGKLGSVAGWGFTEANAVSDELKQLTMPYIERAECLQIVPQGFQQFVTLDKYCAGYTNGSSLCKGDTGGGMVFPQLNFGSERYYIQGIASIGPSNSNGCDDHQLAVYTKVYAHLAFIKTIQLTN